MEDFVSINIAKVLKEKGFNRPCVKHYINGQVYISPYSNAYNYECKETINIPTISQVLKWLREDKSISIEPCATPHNCWYYMIKYNGQIKVTYLENKYKTYEQAALAGIEYVLDNLI